MARIAAALHALNRGEVSTLALARVDVDRMRLSAETQVNWLPRTIGPAMLRPGTAYITSTRSNLATRLLPFIYSNSDTALLELTDSTLRVLVNDAVITRPSVATTVANFSSAGSWTLVNTGGATTSLAGSVLTMNLGSLGGVSTATQAVTLGGGASGIEHALRVVVSRGPVKFRVGSSSGADDYITTTSLDDGTHSLALTPSGTFYIQFEASKLLDKIVSSITIEASGVMTLPTPWTASYLPLVRIDQSADVVFAACTGFQQRRIERRSTRSWSVALYKSDAGPYNTSADSSINITPTALNGSGVALTSDKPVFKSTHVGALFRLFHSGQKVKNSLATENVYGDAIRVTGVGTDRTINIAITGTWVGTVTLQRSFDSATTGFIDTTSTYVANTTTSLADGLSNSIVWYRLGIKSGAYTSGTAVCELNWAGGGAAGVGRVTAYSNSKAVTVEVLDNFANTTSTNDWKEGAWSDKQGWPSAVALHEGRLWWAGNDRFWGSVSDDYSSYDIDTEGDSGPIDRTIGQGPIARVSWLSSLTRLLGGCDRSVISARSSSFDEPLTPTNFNLKESTTQGAFTLPCIKVDNRALYVQASNRRVYECAFDVSIADYKLQDLTRLNPDIGYAGFSDLAVQRQPDTFVHFVRADGQVASLLYDTQDNVEAWWRIQSDGASGLIENVCVLPGTLEDSVYFVVKRVVNGSTVRYIEKMARLDQCVGGTLSRLADSHIVYQSTATTSITGLSHLEGQSVVVWADGRDVGTKTVSSGAITLDTAASNVCAGLPYSATYKSSKLAYAAQGGTALNQKKRVDHIGLLLQDTHYQGLTYGQDEDHLDALPLVEIGKVTAADYVWDTYDQDMIELNGVWDTDARVVLKAAAPRPVTVLGIVVGMVTNG